MAVNLSKEVSEFIAAFKAGKAMFSTTEEDYKKAKTKLLQAQAANASDPEAQKLNKDVLRARIAASNRTGADVGGVRASQAEFYRARTEGERQRQRLIDQQSAAPAVDPALVQGAEQFRAPQQAGAIPTDPTADPNLTYGYSRGGAVPHYADGGYVEEDDDTDGGVADVAPEPDIEDDAPEASGALEVSSQSRQRGYAPQAAHDAVLDALKRGQKAYGLDGAVASNPRGARDYVSGKGAYTPAEYQAVSRAIDPENKLPVGQRNLKILGAMYQYHLGKGDLEKAQQAAMRLTQFYRIASARFSALAATAAQDGNLDEAAKAAAQAFGFIPNGQDLKLTKSGDGKLSYTVTDENGRQVSKGIMSAEELVAAASRINFDEMITNAAGQRAAGGGGGSKGKSKEPGVRKLTDRDEAVGAINSFVEGSKATKLDPGTAEQTKFAASQLLSANDIDARTALSVAVGIANGQEGYNLKMGEGDGTITTPEGRRVRMSQDALDNLIALRATTRRAREKTAAEGKAKAEREEKRQALNKQVEEATSASSLRRTNNKPTRTETLRQHFGALPLDEEENKVVAGGV